MMRTRKEKIRKLKGQSRASYIRIINSRKGKKNRKEGKTHQNNSRTFPRAEGYKISHWKCSASGHFRTLGTKRKNPTNFQREKTAVKVSNNSFPIHPFSRSYWREYSAKTRVNQEKGGLGIQEIQKPAQEGVASCVQMPRASGPGGSVKSSPRRWINTSCVWIYEGNSGHWRRVWSWNNNNTKLKKQGNY